MKIFTPHKNSRPACGISRPRAAFTLVELLVVIAVIAMLMAILLPVMGRARLQAKILAVNVDLRNIGLALDSYAFDHAGKLPPTREDCMIGEHFHQLPEELADMKYLPQPQQGTPMAIGMEDRFNKGCTYKYRAVGDLILNRGRIRENRAWLWVPDGFPDNEQETGKSYYKIQESPVSWVIYSQGPEFEFFKMREMHYPVPTKTWYHPGTRTGIITRMRLQKGRHIGHFQS